VLFGVEFLMLKGIVSAFKTLEISTTAHTIEHSGSCTIKPQILQKHMPLVILLKTVYCVIDPCIHFWLLAARFRFNCRWLRANLTFM